MNSKLKSHLFKDLLLCSVITEMPPTAEVNMKQAAVLTSSSSLIQSSIYTPGIN